MPRLLEPYSELIYAAMRVVAGFLFACHGAQKYFGVLGGTVQIHTAKGLIAGSIELIGGTLIALGLFTSIAAFLASGEMAVAYFWVHNRRCSWPILNKGELAALLCFLFLYIAANGPGRYSFNRPAGGTEGGNGNPNRTKSTSSLERKDHSASARTWDAR